MSVLVIAEHDNASLKAATRNAVAAAAEIDADVHVLVRGPGLRPGRRGGGPGGGRREGARRRGCGLRTRACGECREARGRSGRRLQPCARALDRERQEQPAARGGPARRRPDFRHHGGRVGGHLRAAHLCGQRHGEGPVQRPGQAHHGAHDGVRRGAGRGRVRPGRGGLRLRQRRAFQLSSGASSPNPSARNSPPPASSSPAGAAWAPARTSTFWEALADRLGAAVRGLARGGRCGLCAERLPGRARRARWSRRNST